MQRNCLCNRERWILRTNYRYNWNLQVRLIARLDLKLLTTMSQSNTLPITLLRLFLAGLRIRWLNPLHKVWDPQKRVVLSMISYCYCQSGVILWCSSSGSSVFSSVFSFLSMPFEIEFVGKSIYRLLSKKKWLPY